MFYSFLNKMKETRDQVILLWDWKNHKTIFVSRKRENSIFLTPLNYDLNALTFALKDSADAFVMLH